MQKKRQTVSQGSMFELMMAERQRQETGRLLACNEKTVKKVEAARELYNEMIGEFDSYGNVFYEDTVAAGMPAFFISYDARFNPQDHILTLDYPTITPLGGLCGIDAVYEYLCRIRLEQRFLKSLPDEYVAGTLTRYDRGYRKLPINLRSVVLRNLTGRLIAGKKLDGLQNTQQDRERLGRIAAGKNREQIEKELLKITKILAEKSCRGCRKLYEYMACDAAEAAALVAAAGTDRDIGHIFVI